MEFKSGYVSIIGRPNAGKSTLLNTLLGEKIAAVSDKPQTTRRNILGIITDKESQIIFVDTPGLHKTQGRNAKDDAKMKAAAAEAVEDADITLYLIDVADKYIGKDEAIIRSLHAPKLILLLNKVDLVPDEQKHKLLPLMQRFLNIRQYEEIIPLSALDANDGGIAPLLNAIKSRLPVGPMYFPEDSLTDLTEREVASELIREKLMRLLSKELPFGITVEVTEMRLNAAKNLTFIEADIYCEKESHKPIIIGKGGAMLKQVGIMARQDLEAFLGNQVNLSLNVSSKQR